MSDHEHLRMTTAAELPERAVGNGPVPLDLDRLQRAMQMDKEGEVSLIRAKSHLRAAIDEYRGASQHYHRLATLLDGVLGQDDRITGG
jgi:hypothetical protein